MKISTRGEYGLRAMIYLARHHRDGLVQAREIAGQEDIPVAYLNHLLSSLRHAGLIFSTRGPAGGHTLARRPEDITLMDILGALEGSFAPSDCVADGNSQACERATCCALRDVWAEIKGSTEEVLRSTTLQGLVEKESAQAPSYQI